MSTENLQQQLTLTWRVDGKENTYTITSERSVILGRRLDVDIVLSDPSISRQHATIEIIDGKFHLRNLSAVNPVYMVRGNTNTSELQQNQTAILEAGTVFQIGPIQIKITALKATTSEKAFKIKCSSCGQLAEADLTDCPWCGTSLAFGQSVFIDIAE